jgi:tyrosine-protein kinase Etk/Wzc
LHKQAYKNQRYLNLKRSIFAVCLSYWPWFVSLMLIALAGAWCYLNFSKPVYVSEAKIKIEASQSKTGNNTLPNHADYFPEGEDYQTAIKQIEPALYVSIENLQLYIPVFKVSRFSDIPVYHNGPVTIVAKPDRVKDVTNVPFFTGKNSIKINGKSYPLNQWVNTPFGTLQFKLNSKFVVGRQNEKFYFSLIQPGKLATALSSRLKLHYDKTSDIVNISFRDEVALRGKDVLTELIRNYDQTLITHKKNLINESKRRVNEQIAQIENDLLSMENKTLYNKLTTENKGEGDTEKRLLKEVQENDQKASELNNALIAFNNLTRELQDSRALEIKVPVAVKPRIKGVLAMIAELNKQQSSGQKLSKAGDEQEANYVSNQNKFNALKAEILTSLRREISKAQADRNYLLQKNNDSLAQLIHRVNKPTDFIDIEKEQQAKRTQYVYLLKMNEQLELASISKLKGISVISEVETAPVSGNNQFIYLGAVFTALITGFGVVVKKEGIDKKIQRDKDIESITRVPVIGKVSAEKSESKFGVDNRRQTVLTDDFRKLRTVLNFLNMDNKVKRILVTSGIDNEGKSFISSNLALSEALSGKKVVLLNPTLNYPVLSGLNKSKRSGSTISGYINGIINSAELVQQTDINQNFFFIENDGVLQENASWLFNTAKGEALLSYLDEVFDYTIIDIGMADAVSTAGNLSALCDVTIYVVRQGYTPKAAVEGLELKQLHNAGIVLNGV